MNNTIKNRIIKILLQPEDYDNYYPIYLYYTRNITLEFSSTITKKMTKDFTEIAIDNNLKTSTKELKKILHKFAPIIAIHEELILDRSNE